VQLRYNYRLYPGPGQRLALARAFGCARVVFNDGLRLRQQAHEAGLPCPTDAELSARLTAAKATPERAWLAEVSAVVLQQALADLNAAYRNFFSSAAGTRKGPRVALPRFRSRKDWRQAVRFTRNARFAVTAAGRLRLPKVGDVPVRWSRPLPAPPSSVTVIADASGRYFASFVVEAGTKPLPACGPEVGIDLGLTHFAVLSDGRKIANPRFLRRAERKLRKAQQDLSRKQKGSANRARARVKVARGCTPGWLTPGGTGCTRNPPASSATAKRCTWRTCACPAGPHPAGQVGARRRLVGVHRHAGVQGRPVRAHLRPDQPVGADLPGVLGVRGERRPQAPERPRVDLRPVRDGA
jgi:hypothetical protein